MRAISEAVWSPGIGELSVGGRVGSSRDLGCSGSEGFSLWLLDVLREDGVVTANDPVRLASVGLGWWGNVLAEGAVAAGAEIVGGFARSPQSRD